MPFAIGLWKIEVSISYIDLVGRSTTFSNTFMIEIKPGLTDKSSDDESDDAVKKASFDGRKRWYP